MLTLGYRRGRSPFPINADLEFVIPIYPSPSLLAAGEAIGSGSNLFEVDESGNPVAVPLRIQFGCYLTQETRSAISERVPGQDLSRIAMKGRVIERVRLALNGNTIERLPMKTLLPEIRSGLVSECALYPPGSTQGDLSQIRGLFEIEIPVQSPWTPVRFLGDKIKGMFQQESVYGNTA